MVFLHLRPRATRGRLSRHPLVFNRKGQAGSHQAKTAKITNLKVRVVRANGKIEEIDNG